MPRAPSSWRRRNLIVVATLAVVPLAYAGVWSAGKLWRRSQNYYKAPPTVAGADRPILPSTGPAPPMPHEVTFAEHVPEVRVETIASGLEIVWDIAFTPDGRLLFTERPGRVRVIRPGNPEPALYAELPTVLDGESGLMSIALHPRFPREPFVYVMYTARKRDGGVNRISRFTDSPSGARDEHVLLDDIPAARNHDGGALEFGPDGMLYIGCGDAGVPYLSQDLGQLPGKILRITPEGTIPADNPFPGSPIWAYGFRNVSGLAFHPKTGALWAASHGPSSNVPGEPRHMDSVYVVRKGRNHGWPVHLGVSGDDRFVSPVLFWPREAIPPGGLLFYRGARFPAFEGSLFMTSLRSELLHRIELDALDSPTRIERWWPRKFGRLRALAEAPDGSIYIGTSNRDGRTEGSYPSSDFILRLVPEGRRP